MQCPGQDTRFWTPDDIFEIPCQACGRAVEFFKTDVARRCPGCGERIQNPRVSLGCARWCAYAKQCLGFDPAEVQLVDSQQGSLMDRLVAALRREPEQDEGRITHALQVLQQAQELLRVAGGDPKVVLAAALLHDVGLPRAERVHASAEARFHEAEGRPIARRLLQELEVDGETVDHVCRIVGSHHSADDVDSPEFCIVWDADHLVEVPPALQRQSPERLRAIVDQVFRTPAGRDRALRLAQPPDSQPTGTGADGHA